MFWLFLKGCEVFPTRTVLGLSKVKKKIKKSLKSIEKKYKKITHRILDPISRIFLQNPGLQHVKNNDNNNNDIVPPTPQKKLSAASSSELHNLFGKYTPLKTHTALGLNG